MRVSAEQLAELRKQTALLDGIKDDADPENPANCPETNTTYFSTTQDVPAAVFR